MRVRSIVTTLTLAVFLVPSVVWADGMVVAPPNYWVEETGQRAVIMHEKGVETLVLSTSFQGDAKDFAWIVPTPSKPDVSKGTQEVFTNLQKLTRVSNLRIENVGGTLGLGGSPTVEDSVTVYEEKQVDYYDVAVLSSTDKDALAAWLKEKGYNYPEEASYLLQEYINNQWYFVAMRVNPEALGFTNVNAQLRSGGATPVVLRFATERIVYPLRISSARDSNVTPPTVTTKGKTVEGKFGGALALSASEVNTYKYVAGYDLPYLAGTVETYVKLDPWISSGYRNIASVVDSAGSRVMHVRLAKDTVTSKEYLQFIWYQNNSTSAFYGWSAEATLGDSTWHHVALTWSEAGQPIFYLDGNPLVTTSSTGSAWRGKQPTTGSAVTIGGDPTTSSSALRGAVDSLGVWSVALTPEQVKERTLAPVVKDSLGKYPQTLSLFAPYDTNGALYDDQGREVSIVQQIQPVTKRYQSQTITLYVLADERKDATGFTTRYANWFPKQTVRDLAFASDGAPLLPAESKKHFVTVLTRTISGTGTLEDVFFRSATNQATIGVAPGESGADMDWKFWVFVGACAFLSLLFLVVLLWRTHVRQGPIPPQPLSQ